jgi:hypothetical protein
MKPIFRILMIVVAVAVGAAWYVHWARTRALNSGDVFVREESGDNSRPESANQPARSQELADNGTGAPGGLSRPQDNVATIPTSDTISRNPLNGIVLARPGRYQLYRQGDITWRMDTDNGDACVLFATVVQWGKTIVYDHGCGSR